MSFKTGDRVLVISECNSKGESGTVSRQCGDWRYVTVKLDSGNLQSYNTLSLQKIGGESGIMKGTYMIAVVNLIEDHYKKDYGFALYEDAKVGDLVVVNPKDTYSVATVKSILTQEAYGKGVSKEVVGVVNMEAYAARANERKRIADLEKEKREIQRKLDAKISVLKDLDFYERAAADFSERDPEIAEMVSKLKAMMRG